MTEQWEKNTNNNKQCSSGTEGLLRLFLPSPCSGLQPGLGSPERPSRRWTGKHGAPPPAPGHRGNTAAAPGLGASAPGRTERGRSRCRSAAGACTADRTSTWPLKNRVLIRTATCPNLNLITQEAGTRPVTSASAVSIHDRF